MLAASVPFFWILGAFYFNQLGLNPFATLIKLTAHTAIALLIMTLAITPLRRWLITLFRFFPQFRYGKRLSDWNVLIRLRRTIGLFSFFYATLHVWVYFDLELAKSFSELAYEISTRQFIVFGLIAWILLIPLAITSLNRIQKKMGKWWRRLHRAIYGIVILVFIHHLLAVKATDFTPYLYGLLIFILLGHRILVATIKQFRQRQDDGMEAYRN